MIRIVIVFIILIVSTIATAETLPFKTEYLDDNCFKITVEGEWYKICKDDDYDGMKSLLPFNYEFEPDGDVDIFYEGRSYDIDNPDDDAADAVEDVLKAFFGSSSTKKKVTKTRSSTLKKKKKTEKKVR